MLKFDSQECLPLRGRAKRLRLRCAIPLQEAKRILQVDTNEHLLSCAVNSCRSSPSPALGIRELP